MDRFFKVFLTALFYVLLIFFLLFLFTGCRTKYVAVPSIQKEYVVQQKTDTLRDSIYHRDSIIIERRGDTVYHTRTRTRDKIRYVSKLQTDTLLRVDSISIPYPVEVESASSKRWARVGKASLLLMVLTAGAACILKTKS